MRLRSSAAQGDRETGIAGKTPALRDWADKGSPQNVECFRRYDQGVAGACLLAALGGIQIDVVDVAALHPIEPRVRRPVHPAKRDLRRITGRSGRIGPSVRPGCTRPFRGRAWTAGAPVAASFRNQSSRVRPCAAAFAASAAACSSGSWTMVMALNSLPSIFMVKDIGSLVTDSHTPPVAGWILNSRVASAAV